MQTRIQPSEENWQAGEREEISQNKANKFIVWRVCNFPYHGAQTMLLGLTTATFPGPTHGICQTCKLAMLRDAERIKEKLVSDGWKKEDFARELKKELFA